ncbi:hypothetical protein SAMN05421751_11024 [Jhaorihella thermophila]|uniref:Uncharacterized protein n=1 Tax=Jhaorihella thermophila TaxID=488547 RepID=A0A1H5X7P2_9RHOB|nr:hypothetical protein SAMN05421751_11024 [Jhaorihella thermophila]
MMAWRIRGALPPSALTGLTPRSIFGKMKEQGVRGEERA